jgi:hypothetical protein
MRLVPFEEVVLANLTTVTAPLAISSAETEDVEIKSARVRFLDIILSVN